LALLAGNGITAAGEALPSEATPEARRLVQLLASGGQKPPKAEPNTENDLPTLKTNESVKNDLHARVSRPTILKRWKP
jgi:hypothetical protein